MPQIRNGASNKKGTILAMQKNEIFMQECSPIFVAVDVMFA
jgi:hypothetical protein